MGKIKSFFKKIRNWLVFGEYVNLFIVSYKCESGIGTLVVKSKDKFEAVFDAKNELKQKYGCKQTYILEVYEY